MTAAIDEIRQRFSKDLFATKQAGIEILEASKNHSRCMMRVTPDHMNAAGTVMGGAIYTLADFCFAVAANTDNPLTVTLSSSVEFLRASKADVLYGECTLVKDGKNICFFRISVTEEDGKEISVVSASGYRSSR